MPIEKVVRRRIRRERDGVHIAAEVNAVIAATIGERGESVVRAATDSPIVQTSRRRKPSDTGGDQS